MHSPDYDGAESDKSPIPESSRMHIELPPPRRPLLSTRERILYATSVLLSLRGYAGTSIRSIGEAIGVRGPSIYHHFESKDAIVQELLDYSLARPAAFAELMVRTDGDIAVRTYRYVRFDIHHMAFSVNDLRGLHTAALMSMPQFSSSVERLRGLRADVRRLIRSGVSDGRYRDVDEYVVIAALEGIFNLTPSHYEQHPEAVDAATDFLFLSLLADPSELPEVREKALAYREQDEAFDSNAGRRAVSAVRKQGTGSSTSAGNALKPPASFDHMPPASPTMEDLPQLLGAMQEEVAEIRQALARLTEGRG